MAKRVNTRFVATVGIVCVVLAGTLIGGPLLKGLLTRKPLAQRVKTLSEEAHKAAEEGRYAEARDKITRAWKLDPTNKDVCIDRGDVLAMLTAEDGPIAMDQARAAWQNALAIDPSYKPALQRLLTSYIELLEVRPSPEACLRLRESATRMYQIDPTDTRAKSYIQIATIQQWVQGMPTTNEQNAEAIANLAALQKESPSSPDLLFYLLRGKTFQATEDYRTGHGEKSATAVTESRALLQAVETKYPKDASLNFRVFQGYVMLMEASHDPEQLKKDHKSADDALHRAMQEVKQDDPRYDDFQYVASDWARRNGHLDESEKILRDFYAIRKNDQRVRLALCRVLALTGDLAKRSEAIDILRLQIAGSSGTGVKSIGIKELEAQTLLDLTSMRVAQYPTLDAAKRQALMAEIEEGYRKIDLLAIPDAVPVLRLKGLIAQLKGENVEAVKALARAMTLLEHSDSNNPIKYDLMYQLATVERLAQQNRAAEKWLMQIVERFDNYAPARFQLADLYLEENNFSEAARHIEILAKQKPGSADVTRLQIMLAQRSSRPQDAKALVAQLPEATFDEKLNKAQMSANLLDYPTAIRLLLLMQKDRPDDPGIAVALFQAYSKAGPDQLELGRKVLSDALQKHPNDPRLLLVQKQDQKATPAQLDHFMDELIDKGGDPFYVKIREARRALTAGNFPEALARTRDADQLRHNDTAVWDLYFSTYMAQQDWPMAERAVENLSRLNADQAGGKMFRWKLAMARKQFNEAISVARELTVEHDDFGQSWVLLGQAYQANGQFSEAIEKYQAALERQTTNIEAYRGMADCYDALSKPDRALDAVGQGLRLFPDSVYLRERRLNYITMTDPVAVVPERQKLLDENPKETENYLALAAACVQAAQKVLPLDPAEAKAYTDRARDVLTKGVGMFPDHIRLNGALADAMQSSGNFDAGVKILTDLAATPKWKDKPDPAMVLGEYYARARKTNDAEKCFREAWAKTGNKNIEIQLRIVALLEEVRKPESFDKCLELLKQNADDPRIARQTLQVHIAANHTEIARKGLLEAIEKSPKDVNLINLLAVVYIDGQRYDDARKVLGDALAIDPRNDVALYYQALVELRDVLHGNLDVALHNLQIVVEKNPRNVQFRIESAGAKARVRDYEGAAGDLEEALKSEPYNRDARLHLLDLYTQTKKWAKFEQVVSYAELNVVISGGIWFRAHAYALSAQEKYPEAIKKIVQAIDIEPQNAVYARDYLIILLQSKDYDGVINQTGRLLASGRQEWWVYHLKGLAKSGKGNKAEALEQLDKAMAVADAAKDEDAYQQILSSMADISIDDAIARLVPRIATSDRWRLQSVTLHMRRTQWVAAMTELEPLLKKRAELPRDTRLAALRLAAETYQSSGKPEVSKTYYLEWLKESPNDATALNNFAYLLAEDLNLPAEAKKYSQQAYDSSRKLNYVDPLIVDTHGWILTLNGGNDANRGLSLLSSLVDGHGDFLEARYHLARGYLKTNRPADAALQLKATLDQIKAMEDKGQNVRPQFKENVQKYLVQAQQASASTH